MSTPARQKTILAIASSGGHWEQLMQLRPAFDGDARIVFATTDLGQAAANNLAECYELADYNADEPLNVAKGLIETRRLMRKVRPDIVISTGAAPGLLCLFWGKTMGAKTIWIDSIANPERISLSGRLAKRFADIVLTQWEHLATDGVQYWGSVL